MKKIIVTTSLVFIVMCLRAAIHPANNTTLNQTQILFEVDEKEFADNYTIYIQELNNAGNTERTMKAKTKTLAVVVSDFFQFGKNYSWYYTAQHKRKELFKSAVFNFSINNYFLVDTSLFKTKVISAVKNKFNNDLIFLDNLGVAINRKGEPVWYYPYIPKENLPLPAFRNLTMTKDGTITFLDNTDCSNISLDGQLLWQGPNDGKVSGASNEFYHHDFKKMDDGTFMVSSYQYEQQPNYFDPNVSTNVRYNTLIQYDQQGKVLWSWNEKDHISRETLFRGASSMATTLEGTHLNGFAYDTATNTIVMSCRNNSNILRIDKATGNVIFDLSNYTAGYKKRKAEAFTNMQHGPSLLPDGEILIYNNNVPDDTTKMITFPEVIILKENGNDGKPVITWKYECRFEDDYPKGLKGKEGYAVLLPDKNILVCLGGGNHTFEVTPQKEIVWHAKHFKFDTKTKEWVGFNNYRNNAASSLYPSYFTLQHIYKKKQNSNMLNFKINNEGSETDQYEINVVINIKVMTQYMQKVTVDAKKSATISIPLDDEIKDIKSVSIVVTPKSNSNYSKIIDFKN